jgi:aryl-alcohol dehydrogenase-like predicted oxidoreductase
MAAWEFQALQNIAKQNGWHQFISMQDYYSLLYREEEREMIPYCRDAGVGIIPYSALARGLLARPYKSESEPTTREKTDAFHSEFMRGKTTPADIEVIRRVEELARKKGVGMAVICIVWCLEKGVNPILGLGSIERVDQAVEAVRHAKASLLSKEEIAFLEDAYVAKPIIGFS